MFAIVINDHLSVDAKQATIVRGEHKAVSAIDRHIDKACDNEANIAFHLIRYGHLVDMISALKRSRGDASARGARIVVPRSRKALNKLIGVRHSFAVNSGSKRGMYCIALVTILTKSLEAEGGGLAHHDGLCIELCIAVGHRAISGIAYLCRGVGTGYTGLPLTKINVLLKLPLNKTIVYLI